MALEGARKGPPMVQLPEITLSGTQVRLEPLRHSHLEGLLSAATFDRSTFSLTSVPNTAEGMEQYLQTTLADRARGESLPFATVDARSGQVVGSSRFCAIEHWSWPGPPPPPVPSGPDAVEIGWTWLGPTAQRTGINTEAKLLMLRHAFETWGVRRVTLKTDARNQRSRAAIERLGCRPEGILRAHRPAADGGVRDSAMYSLLSSEWPAVKQQLLQRLR